MRDNDIGVNNMDKHLLDRPHYTTSWYAVFIIECLKLCDAKTVYIRFQADFRLNQIPLKCVTYFVVDAQLFK